MATLQQQLEAFKEQVSQQAPASVLSGIQNNIDELIQSDLAKQALKVGQQAPDFILPNAVGEQVSLSELLRQGPVVVTFYRGGWCPYCNLQLRAYQEIVPQIKELGASLVAISPQTPDHSLSMAEKHALTFGVLSDKENTVAHSFGLVFTPNEQLRAIMQQVGSNLPEINGVNSWELPMPSTFIIAQDGTIKVAHVDPDFRNRMDPTAILDGLRALNK